ncbi:ABC transporter permease [Streptococcus dentiloxodontae]
MFWKLVKYEFKSVGKWYISLYGIAFGLSIVLGVFFRNLLSEASLKATEITIPDERMGWPLAILFVICFLGFVFVLSTIIISTVVLIIRRFATNIYGREGYLTNTLPVNQHQLIFSKLLAASSWSVLSGITFLLSIFLVATVASTDSFFESLTSSFEGFRDGYFGKTVNFNFPLFFLSIVYIIVSVINAILGYYLAISIGSLFKNHKVLMSFVTYFTIAAIASTISAWGADLLNISFTNATTAADFTAYFLYTTIIVLIYSVLYYFGTHCILKKHLNLD